MSKPIIQVEKLSKLYRLGEVGADTIRESVEILWHRLTGKKIVSPARRKKGPPLNEVQRGPKANTFWALKDVSFSVNQGEVVGVIGRNGAGKSTLLKVLSKITDPTEGKAILRGRVASLLEVGTGFHQELTGRENIYLNGSVLGMRKREIDKKFDEIIAFSELDDFLDTPVKHYSSGMYMRLGFAVAAHLEPEILLVDEVLAVGDVQFQKKCLGKIGTIAKKGHTVLFVSHSMSAIQSLCQSIILMESGRTSFIGPTNEGIQMYLEDKIFDNPTEWDLERVERVNELIGSNLRLIKIEACPNRKGGFDFNEPLRFIVSFKSNFSAEGIGVELAIDDMLGQRITTFESHRVNYEVDVKKGVSYQCELEVPSVVLLPGSYYLSIGLYAGRNYYDFLKHFGSLRINPLDFKTGKSFELGPSWGVFLPASSWKSYSGKNHEARP